MKNKYIIYWFLYYFQMEQQHSFGFLSYNLVDGFFTDFDDFKDF